MTRTVVALGGNTLLRRGEGTVEEQRAHVGDTADALSVLVDRGDDLAFTHGNGPQVGYLLLQQEHAPGPRFPLDVLVAETQAQLGYLLQQAFANRLGVDAVSLVSQVVVDPDDPAFDDPTKPVGPFYTAAEAADQPFETRRVGSGDEEQAYRRVVPSPRPLELVEADEVRALMDAGATVVTGGGGGVPVVREEGGLRGVEAVVDKDHTARVLAGAIDADELVVLTDVDAAYVDYGTEEQRPLGEVTPEALRAHLDAGEFGAGSMRPKVEACLAFVRDGGRRALVTSPERLDAALAGEAGTRVVG